MLSIVFGVPKLNVSFDIQLITIKNSLFWDIVSFRLFLSSDTKVFSECINDNFCGLFQCIKFDFYLKISFKFLKIKWKLDKY